MVTKSNIRLLTMLLMLLTNLSLSAAIVTIDRTTVRVNETFELTINLNNQPDQIPDLSALPDDLEILSNNNFYRRSIINGQSTQQSGWRFTVRARQEGIFTIPSIQVEGVKTKPLTIKVLPAVNTAEIDGQEDAIRLTSEIDLSEVYVQQQIVYTIRLYRSVQAQYATLSEPQLKGALIEQLGEDIQFDTIIDATAYRVLERKYAIYPQESGEFDISGVVYTAEVSSGNRRFSTLGSLRSRNRSVSLTTESKTINVKPIPSEYNDWWLPAKKVSVTQNWSSNTNSLEVGTPITWTYAIQAKGLTATQIPDIQPKEVPGLKFYPEQPVSKNEFSDSDIVASRTQKIAVIPTNSGEITIPEIKIAWWDVTNNQPQTLVIPGKKLTVLPGKEEALRPNVPEVTEAELSPSVVSDVPKLPSNETKTNTPQLLYWQIATGVMVILWLITLFWRRSIKQAPVTTSDRMKADLPQTPKVTLSEVKSTLTDKDVAGSRKAIISYVQAQDYQVNSLSDIIQLQPDSELSIEIRHIDRAIFGQGNNDDWQVETIIKGLQTLPRNTEQQTTAQGDKVLPPLHPE